MHSYILELALTPGTRVLRLEDSPDRHQLDSLRKEFGHEILTNQFAHAIPSNKHLRPKELVAIISHLNHLAELNDQAKRDIRKWVSRLGYHGYGHTMDDLGIVIYDPSRLRLLKIWAVDANEIGHSISNDLQRISTPRLSSSVPAKLLRRAELEIDSSEKRLRYSQENDIKEEIMHDPDYQSKIAERLTELEHRRKMLDEYRSRQS